VRTAIAVGESTRASPVRRTWTSFSGGVDGPPLDAVPGAADVGVAVVGVAVGGGAAVS
jgi:hypothetical protein